MAIEIRNEWPPNLAQIASAFGNQKLSTVYAWKPFVYVPSGAEALPDDLVAHELTHFDQQDASGGPAAWWARYLEEPAFRLLQELEAYRAQLAAHPSRQTRRACLRRVVRDLAGPMYGHLVNADVARELLTAAHAAALP